MPEKKPKAATSGKYHLENTKTAAGMRLYFSKKVGADWVRVGRSKVPETTVNNLLSRVSWRRRSRSRSGSPKRKTRSAGAAQKKTVRIDKENQDKYGFEKHGRVKKWFSWDREFKEWDAMKAADVPYSVRYTASQRRARSRSGSRSNSPAAAKKSKAKGKEKKTKATKPSEVGKEKAKRTRAYSGKYYVEKQKTKSGRRLVFKMRADRDTWVRIARSEVPADHLAKLLSQIPYRAKGRPKRTPTEQ